MLSLLCEGKIYNKMKSYAFEVEINTNKSLEMLEITDLIQDCVDKSGIKNGICFLLSPHTSTSLTMNERTDADLPDEILSIMHNLIPQLDNYSHYNSSSHVLASIFGSNLNCLIRDSKLYLRHWQGLYLIELDGPRKPRRIIVTIISLPNIKFVNLHTKKVYSKIQINKGKNGVGGPLIVLLTNESDKILSLVKSKKHDCAQHIADLSGGTVIYGLDAENPFNEIRVVVMDYFNLNEIQEYIASGKDVVLTEGVAISPSNNLESLLTHLVTDVIESEHILRL
jgi:secondary thiamine-phosphate synthase enzyme